MRHPEILRKHWWLRLTLRLLAKRASAPSRLRCFCRTENEFLMIGKPVGEKPLRTAVYTFSSHCPGEAKDDWPPQMVNPFNEIRNRTLAEQLMIFLWAIFCQKSRYPFWARIVEVLTP